MKSNFHNKNCEKCSRGGISTVWESLKILLTEKSYLISILPLALLFAFIFVSIPVFLVQGNSFLFQLSLYSSWHYVMVALLSILSSLLVLSGVYRYQKQRKGAGSSGIGVVSGILASIFLSPACPMCVAAIFGFLGFGVVSFLVSNYLVIFSAGFLVLAISLYVSLSKMPLHKRSHHE